VVTRLNIMILERIVQKMTHNTGDRVNIGYVAHEDHWCSRASGPYVT